MLPLKAKNVHFVGIGGIGMSALAQILLARGYGVTGSDVHETPMVARLRSLGATVNVGHRAENVNGAEVLVTSTAIREDNPEVAAAISRGIPRLHRADLLNLLMAEGTSLAVTGTHGKTTTTALLAWVLEVAGLGGTAVVGGEAPQLQGNARLGDGNLIVAEVDESDKTIERMSAHLALVTNLEPDHLDHYRDIDEIIATVHGFAARARALVLCWDDQGVRRLAELLGDQPVITYGFGPDADYQACDVAMDAAGSTFTVRHRGETLGTFRLALLGRHNIANALGVLALTRQLDVPLDRVGEAFRGFAGVARRMQPVGRANGVDIYDDYAHHPTEIAATLAAARLQDRPLVVIFQPHRYSRTLALLDEFPASFAGADRVIITDIYPASEDPARYPVDAATLVARIRAANPGKPVDHCPDFAAVLDVLPAVLRPGDVVLALGAGDIPKLSLALLARLEAPLEAPSTR